MLIEGGRVLVDGALHETDILVDDGRITDVGASRPERRTLDARGLLVLPGIVDLHGDAFERQLQPRPGVDFPVAGALEETERQLLANGITTAFHAITLSWEPGLRSPPMWRAILDALDAGDWTCDMRVHMRWEAHNLDALDMALADIAGGRVDLLSFNDHTPAILERLDDPARAQAYIKRGPLDAAGFRARGAARGGACAEDRAGAAGDRRGGADGRADDGQPRRRQPRGAGRIFAPWAPPSASSRWRRRWARRRARRARRW